MKEGSGHSLFNAVVEVFLVAQDGSIETKPKEKMRLLVQHYLGEQGLNYESNSYTLKVLFLFKKREYIL